MYAGKTTGSGVQVPTLPNGQINLNALMNAMVSRDPWVYYYTLKIAPGTTFQTQYSLFNYIGGQPDPYPITTGQILSHVETNMPSPASNGFSSPRDLLVDKVAFYFKPGGCGLSGSGPGTFANIADMITFCQYSYAEFKIVDKVFIEGSLEFSPSGYGFTGVSTASSNSVYAVGMVNPHATKRLGKDFAKYLAPQLQWSLTIYFPAGSGPGGAAASTLAQNSSGGGNGLWLVSVIEGLTDRAVQ
jgi:hypothetical protein